MGHTQPFLTTQSKNNVFSLFCLCFPFGLSFKACPKQNAQKQNQSLFPTSPPYTSMLHAPFSQAPRHTGSFMFFIPTAQSSHFEFLSRAGTSHYGQEPCIYTFIPSYNQQTLTEPLLQEGTVGAQENSKMNQSQAYPDKKGN